MRRLRLLLPALCLVLLLCCARAEAPALSISAPGEEIRPGRPVVLSFMVPEDGECSIFLADENASVIARVSPEAGA